MRFAGRHISTAGLARMFKLAVGEVALDRALAVGTSHRLRGAVNRDSADAAGLLDPGGLTLVAIYCLGFAARGCFGRLTSDSDECGHNQRRESQKTSNVGLHKRFFLGKDWRSETIDWNIQLIARAKRVGTADHDFKKHNRPLFLLNKRKEMPNGFTFIHFYCSMSMAKMMRLRAHFRRILY